MKNQRGKNHRKPQKNKSAFFRKLFFQQQEKKGDPRKIVQKSLKNPDPGDGKAEFLQSRNKKAVQGSMDIRGCRKKYSPQYFLCPCVIFPHIGTDRQIKVGKMSVFK